jgi:class 3 adenylate cyclase
VRSDAVNLPAGTVTFVFSDIEGSTALLKRLGDAEYGQLLAIHRRLVREIFAAHEGLEIDTQGDAFFYSFTRARQAVMAAVDLQRAHARASWPGGASVRVRLGLHTGEPVVGAEGYTGLDVVRASRIAAIGRGGQVLVSDATRAIVAGDLGDGVTLRALGDRTLKDIDRPETIFELLIDDLRPPGDATAEIGAEEPSERVGQAEATPSPYAELFKDARQQIESRVLTRLKETLSGDFPFGMADGPQPSAAGGGGRSMTREITRLDRLRRSGALTDAQYQRAVDRLLEGDRGPDVE